MMIAEGEEDKNLDRPLIVQFAGDNGDEIVEAAKYVEGQCDAIDLNLGCPQKIAKGVSGNSFSHSLSLSFTML